MRKAATKALYLFLCSILGMVLFAMLHRSIFVLYDLLLMMDYDMYSLGMSAVTIQALDFLTLLVALFVGGWYGTLLGIDWYALVYGSSVDKPAGAFHGFVPHQWRKTVKKANVAASSLHSAPSAVPATPKASPEPVKVPVTATREWTFEDLITPAKPAPKKRAAAKKTARKTVRKTATKRAAKTAATDKTVGTE